MGRASRLVVSNGFADENRPILDPVPTPDEGLLDAYERAVTSAVRGGWGLRKMNDQ